MKYKVIHIIDNFRLGGAQTFLRDLVIQQNRNGLIEPHVCSLVGKNWISDQVEEAGIRLFSFDVDRRNPVDIVKISFRLFSLIKKNNYDLVHTHLNIANILGRLIAIIARKPVIVHEQRNEKEVINNIEILFSITLNLKTSKVICVSESTRSFNIDVKRVPAAKIVIIPNSIDLNIFSPKSVFLKRSNLLSDLGMEFAEYIVIGVGRLVKEKRYDLFLMTAHQVLKKKTNVIFLIVGDGDQRGELERLSTDLGLSSNVRFLGERAKVVDYLGNSDLFLLLSDFEGLPLTILEAMAMGLPIVATDVDGTGEVLSQGGGILIERNNYLQAAKSVLGLLDDPLKRRKLAEEGQCIVQAQYNIKSIVKQIDKVYEEVFTIQ